MVRSRNSSSAASSSSGKLAKSVPRTAPLPPNPTRRAGWWRVPPGGGATCRAGQCCVRELVVLSEIRSIEVVSMRARCPRSKCSLSLPTGTCPCVAPRGRAKEAPGGAAPDPPSPTASGMPESTRRVRYMQQHLLLQLLLLILLLLPLIPPPSPPCWCGCCGCCCCCEVRLAHHRWSVPAPVSRPYQAALSEGPTVRREQSRPRKRRRRAATAAFLLQGTRGRLPPRRPTHARCGGWSLTTCACVLHYAGEGAGMP
jgi:hypothetical protein